jgi:hypothetical protein
MRGDDERPGGGVQLYLARSAGAPGSSAPTALRDEAARHSSGTQDRIAVALPRGTCIRDRGSDYDTFDDFRGGASRGCGQRADLVAYLVTEQVPRTASMRR